jgi:hypothetical protein
MAEFHPHWYLTAPETLPPIDPGLLALEPRIDRPHGRPMGAVNRPTSQEQASTQCWNLTSFRVWRGDDASMTKHYVLFIDESAAVLLLIGHLQYNLLRLAELF